MKKMFMLLAMCAFLTVPTFAQTPENNNGNCQKKECTETVCNQKGDCKKEGKKECSKKTECKKECTKGKECKKECTKGKECKKGNKECKNNCKATPCDKSMDKSGKTPCHKGEMKKCPKDGHKKFHGSREKVSPFEGLNLTEQQQTQINKLREERKANAEKGEQKMKEARAQEAKKFDEKIQKILTPEQYAAYKANMKKNHSPKRDLKVSDSKVPGRAVRTVEEPTR